MIYIICFVGSFKLEYLRKFLGANPTVLPSIDRQLVLTRRHENDFDLDVNALTCWFDWKVVGRKQSARRV